MTDRIDDLAGDMAWDGVDEARFRDFAEQHGVDGRAPVEELRDVARTFVAERGDQFSEATGDAEAGLLPDG